jgi:hypothetical protein
MDAKSSVAVPLSSPAAAQRCAEGAGLDSGTAAAAQSAMPSIAFLTATAPARRLISAKAAAPAMPQLQSRISTNLTDVTLKTAPSPSSSAFHFFENRYTNPSLNQSIDRRQHFVRLRALSP